MLKMPELKFDEQGICDIVKDNGWKLQTPHEPCIITVLANDNEEVELAIIITQFDSNESLHLDYKNAIKLMLAVALGPVVQTTAALDGNQMIEDALTEGVNDGLTKLLDQYLG